MLFTVRLYSRILQFHDFLFWMNLRFLSNKKNWTTNTVRINHFYFLKIQYKVKKQSGWPLVINHDSWFIREILWTIFRFNSLQPSNVPIFWSFIHLARSKYLRSPTLIGFCKNFPTTSSLDCERIGFFYGVPSILVFYISPASIPFLFLCITPIRAKGPSCSINLFAL